MLVSVGCKRSHRHRLGRRRDESCYFEAHDDDDSQAQQLESTYRFTLPPLPSLLPSSPSPSPCRQEVPVTPGQPTKQPVLIPLAVGLVGSNGSDLPLSDVFDGEGMVSLRGPDGAPVTTAVLRFNKASARGLFVHTVQVHRRGFPYLQRYMHACVLPCFVFQWPPSSNLNCESCTVTGLG